MFATILKLLYEELPTLSRRAGWYIIIGLCAFGADYVVFIYLAKTYGVAAYIANFIAALHGMTVSFTGNMLFNFKVKDKLFLRLRRFVLVNLIGYLISTSVIMLVLRYYDSMHVAKLTSVFFAVGAMFILNYLWTYHGHRPQCSYPPPANEA